MLDAIAGLAPAAERGTPVYSCLSAITAPVALERATSRPLRALFAEHVARPLGMGEEDVLFAPLPAPLRARCAPTEAGRTHEATLVARDTDSEARAARLAAEMEAVEAREKALRREERDADRRAREQARAHLLEARQLVEQALGAARSAVDEAAARDARRMVEEGITTR